MAKTRIKTTPTRMQKEALIASTAVTTTNSNIVTEHVLKKRLTAFNHSMLTKEAIPPIQSTIIVQPPKRTNSISSATSTISHTSDGHSSLESPPPPSISSVGTPTNSNGPTMAELTENAIKTLNAGLLAKSNALALKNRKVYMITEKCDDSSNGAGGVANFASTAVGGGGATGVSGSGVGQKRKMYLIMEEKETDVAEQFMTSSECNNGSKKLTLFTDTANGQLPQKIEKILPEILNCIQAKGGGGGGGGGVISGSNNVGGAVASRGLSNGNDCNVNSQAGPQESNGKSLLKDKDIARVHLKPEKDKNERLPLTLPPKKNRTKIITTQIIPVNPFCYPSTQTSLLPQTVKNGESSAIDRGAAATNGSGNGNGSGGIGVNSYCRPERSSATPVIVNATTLMANATNGTFKVNGSTLSSATQPPQMHKNINLSTDFLFLMKMLPKLESIAEPHKTYVKTCIEDLINQYSTVNQSDDQ